jgi:hypothetical protein
MLGTTIKCKGALIMTDNKIIRDISITVAVITLVAVFILIFLDFTGIYKDVTKGNLLVFLYGIILSFFSIAKSSNSNIKSDSQYRDSLHQAIGGYIPSKELNELVKTHVNKRGGSFSSNINFVNSWNDAEKLKALVEHSECIVNIATKEVTCKVSYRNSEFTAISASKEMALCIAFLKSCGEIPND